MYYAGACSPRHPRPDVPFVRSIETAVGEGRLQLFPTLLIIETDIKSVLTAGKMTNSFLLL